MTKSEMRREKSHKILKKQKIDYLKTLPIIEDELELKNKKVICQRAIANMIAIQVACDYANGNNVDESINFLGSLLKQYNVEDCLNAAEKKLFNKTATQKDAINISWTYECNWVLLWALGKVKELDFPKVTCDCQEAIKQVFSNKTFGDFFNTSNLRSKDELLDTLDLYYRYHWACVDKSINPKTKIGELNQEVVLERRRALEWLFSEEDDWNDISLDT